MHRRYHVSWGRIRESWSIFDLSHGIDGGGLAYRATSVVRHVRHVDLHLVQLLLVGCSHLHHGSLEVSNLVTLALSLEVEYNGVRGKTVSDEVEAVVVSGYSWHGKAGHYHVIFVSMLCQRSCVFDEVCLVDLGEVIPEVDPPCASHDIPVKVCGQEESSLLDGRVILVNHLWLSVRGL